MHPEDSDIFKGHYSAATDSTDIPTRMSKLLCEVHRVLQTKAITHQPDNPGCCLAYWLHRLLVLQSWLLVPEGFYVLVTTPQTQCPKSRKIPL